MTKAKMLKKIAYLEFVNDQLSAEISYIDGLMRSIGFQEGINSIKATAEEIVTQGISLTEIEE